ncbi:MAG: UvrD-helicase domain-containing protein [Treponema sp.]|nr:UvrD-helicase domain-containing protein [Treponema sp.]
MENSLDSLNDEQMEAVTTTEGFVRVIAGAGSGKTRALSHRFAYLVNDIGILPSHILCVTFTNKAASEMRARIKKLTGDNDTGYISTFHGFCVSVLQEDSHAVSYPKSFMVLDNSDINAMLQIIYDERGLTLRQMTFSAARDMIEIQKLFKRPTYYEDMIALSLDALQKKYLEAETPSDIIFYGYLYQQKKCFALDYNDLLKFVLHIFQTNDEIRQKWQERLEYIMIDEFQDIDFIQYELMKALCAFHKNLFVVGDPDQTIYTWRGADIKYLLEFDSEFPGTKTIIMNKNYRSTPEILACANSLISKNAKRISKDLMSERHLPERQHSMPIYCHSKSSEDEALFIAETIESLLTQDIHAGDIAVLFRAHYISRSIEETFQKKKIAYTLFSGLPFFERTEIKDSLCYLRMAAYKDDLSFMRIVNSPKRNVGEKRIAALKEYVEKNGGSLYSALKACAEDEIFKSTKAGSFISLIEKYSSCYDKMQVSELFSHIMNESGYEKALRTEGSQERLDNLAELKQAIHEYEVTCGEEARLTDFLNHLALYTNADIGTDKDAVRLMTVHAAKGLEFPVVFIAGLSENMFPSKKVDSLAAMEEERRLAFVALTRAKDFLYLTDSEASESTPGFGYRYPSRFIFDIDKGLLHYEHELPDELVKNARSYTKDSESYLEKISALAGLEKGDRIQHAILGMGTILEADEVKKQYSIAFDKMPTPRKMSFKAPIKKI